MTAGDKAERAASESAGDVLPVRADGRESGGRESGGAESAPRARAKPSRAARREQRRVRGAPGEERPVHTIRVRSLFG
ncbi:hypothetical protein GL263_01975 [Streptomyces durbertensis]|uniref:Uncharacterized protein n=1 Tax=Streptomyces durbertensis TaxID=2448886 RepID=A0ABR6EAH5_9ACTN|nr:hypothetical protein [Streptomyces durbertensis]MBB1242349.1 hypothetical protein [Streptomyces durbertensis]